MIGRTALRIRPLRALLPVVLACAVASFDACSRDSERGADQPAALREYSALPVGVSTRRLEEHIRYLSSDELEGRAPGTRGEELTLSYLSEQYSSMGLRPGNPDGTYVQAVPLVGFTVLGRPNLSVRSGERTLELAYGDEFMGWTLRQTEAVSVRDAELVFAGYGTVAPEYGWDDFKDADVAGKVIVVLVGDPPLADTTLFGGRAMTYYGRWTYKFEIAAERGAAGAIIVHDTDAAGYPWGVVANSWSGEQFDIERPDAGMSRCAFESWITESAAETLFARAGMRLGEARERAVSQDFRPTPMGLAASIDIRKSLRPVRSHNVAAMVPGHDPARRDELIIFTAHWDHLGKGNPVDGDSIYNGALDNASGVAATLEIARALSEHRGRLARSVLFLNTTAEESGLLGSYYYAENPLHPLTRTVATLNIDGLNIWGRTRDVVVVGFGYSDLDRYMAAAIDTDRRELRPDPEPEKGYYYRSDHFPFAKRGVPSLYADSGVDYVDRPRRWGLEVKQRYTRERYHKPQDEMDASWDLSGAAEDIQAFVRVALMLASSPDYPQWAEATEFRQIREAALEGGR